MKIIFRKVNNGESIASLVDTLQVCLLPVYNNCDVVYTVFVKQCYLYDVVENRFENKSFMDNSGCKINYHIKRHVVG